MDEKIIKKLEKSGLPHKEAVIYAYLLEKGGAFPSQIAEGTKINRSTVYKILDILVIKGLVGEIEKRKKLFYQAENPSRLLRVTQSSARIARDAHEYAQGILPILENLVDANQTKPKVTFYEGKDRVVEAYLSHIDTKKGYAMTAFVSVLDLRKFLPEDKFRHYVREKERLGITVRGITSSEEYSFEFNKDMFTGIDKKIWPDLRFVDKDIFPFPGEVTMFDNKKVSIIKFTENPVAVVIEDKAIHDMMKAIFEIAWVGAKHIS